MPNLQIDRALSVYLCHPIVRRLNGRRPRIPILMYHSIREETEGRQAYYETTTSPQVFAEHMKFLHEGGYTTRIVDNPLEDVAEGQSPKTVFITFDDGYADFYRQAFPILTEYNFTATVYVISSLLKPQGRESFKGTECLTVSELRELHSRGFSIGSHSATHSVLKTLPPAKVENELAESKKSLEEALGAPVKSFAYPFAFPEADRDFKNRLEGVLSQCGYESGVTTILGTVHPGANRFFLPRLPINTWDDRAFFQAKLEGAYDWLHGPQYFAKRVKSFLS